MLEVKSSHKRLRSSHARALGLKKVFAQNISHWKLRMKQLRRSHKFPWSSHNFIDYSHECFDSLSRICFLQKYLIHKIAIREKSGGDRDVGAIAQAVVTVGKSPSQPKTMPPLYDQRQEVTFGLIVDCLSD